MAVLDVESSGPVRRLVLNRPERLNALNDEVRAALHAEIRDLEDDADTRVVVLEGAGRAFSAGFDLEEAPPVEGPWAERRIRGGAWQRLLDDLERIPQVTVAVLHGPVVGGAVLLAAACDFRVAADDTTVSIPEVAIGIPLTWAGLPRLVQEIGLPRTRDLVMTARTASAHEVHGWGFVQRVVPASELPAETDELVQQLLAVPAAPLAMTRAALRALGRREAELAWADADLLAAAVREPEQRDAAVRYVEERLRRSGR